MQRKYVAAAMFAVCLSVLSFGVYRFVAKALMQQERAALDAKWSAAKGYLRIQNYGADWFYDPYDPDEAFIVNALQHVYFLADAEGKPVQFSRAYQEIGLPRPGLIR